MLLVLNLPLVGLWVKLLAIPRPRLYGGILVVASLGAYSVHRSAGDLILVAVIGLLGFGLRAIDAPIAPVMIGLILGPAAEQHLRRALSISQGDWTVFFTRPALGCPPGDRGVRARVGTVAPEARLVDRVLPTRLPTSDASRRSSTIES